MKVAACTLVLAGCFSKPGPPGMAIDAPPLDAPPDAGMQRHEINWAADGTGATVTGEFFTVHFSNRAGGFHFPDSIRINGVEHLGQDDLLTCRAENAVGMAIYPAHRIAAYTGAVIGSNNLVAPRMRGPAAVQLEVIWSTSFTADVTGMFPWTSMRSPSGVSIYTMFPDGRIVRYDTMIDASSDTVDTTSMDCIPGGGATGYYPTSFTTLINPAGTEELIVGQAATSVPPPTGMTVINDQRSACIGFGSSSVAFGWKVNDAGLQTRIRAPGGTTYAFVNDLVMNNNVTAIGAFGYWAESAMFLSQAQSCNASGLHTQADQFAAATQPLLQIGASFLMPENDGIYGGATNPVVVPAGTPVVVQGTIPSSFAIRVQFARAVAGISVSKADTMGPFFTAQRVIGTTDEWVIWFRDPLSASQQIEVTGN